VGNVADDGGVRKIGAGELTEGTSTPGMAREQAVATDGMWAGLVHTEPGMVSGWHHHGEFQTSIYVVSGVLRMEFGAGGAKAVDAAPGDFVYVAPYAIHREGNPTPAPATAVVFRAGQGEVVINVEAPA
jgi:uncharacterized RmlC-like cupin family protein